MVSGVTHSVRRFAVLLVAVLAAPAARAACENILPARGPTPAAFRAVTADDLVRLRDIGQPDGSVIAPVSPLALSPDGRQVAFILTRGDPVANRICRALVAVALDGATPPRILDQGGEALISQVAPRGYWIGNGFPTRITPVWSSDGRELAYLRRDGGITQVWRARADGSGAAAATQLPYDALAVAWAPPRRLLIAAVPQQLAAERAIDAEGRAGWLYDARVVPNVAARPRRSASLPQESFALDLVTGQVAPADDTERAVLAPPRALPEAIGTGGRRAWVERSGASPLSRLRLMARDAAGATLACPAALCSGAFTGLWWLAGGDLVVLRREGWADDTMGLYRWTPGTSAARRILRTEQVLQGCVLAGARLVCTSEASAAPRRIVAIDLHSGTTASIFDPNPEFALLRLGRVERLRWRNDRGLAAWGDLVLPPGFRRDGGKLPLIVVQYRSYGFLRGGTGDEYPIFALAARGFAVLSTERPAFVAATAADVRSFDDVNAVNTTGWAERRSLVSSLQAGIGLVVGRGIADPRRIGITGLSDGSTTARFALVNSGMFAAAALSTCCMDTDTPVTFGGIGLADFFRKMGYPPASARDRTFWRENSMALNAERMRTPLLLQLSDDEYSLALETFTALREHDQPVEMFVFPDEHHIKWQPAHRAAIYARNLDWFDYWLRDRRDPAAAKRDQYVRWDAMRSRLGAADRAAVQPFSPGKRATLPHRPIP